VNALFILLASYLVYPNPQITPGATRQVTENEVCVKGYAGDTRNVTDSEKKQVFDRYGIDWQYHSYFEVDHFISLELGGSNDVTNLWPEPYEGLFNAHMKDLVENFLHQEVCSGKLTLLQAQQAITSDWVLVWQQANAVKLLKAARHKRP
jgi:hypothetical protein